MAQPAANWNAEATDAKGYWVTTPSSVERLDVDWDELQETAEQTKERTRAQAADRARHDETLLEAARSAPSRQRVHIPVVEAPDGTPAPPPVRRSRAARRAEQRLPVAPLDQAALPADLDPSGFEVPEFTLSERREAAAVRDEPWEVLDTYVPDEAEDAATEEVARPPASNVKVFARSRAFTEAITSDLPKATTAGVAIEGPTDPPSVSEAPTFVIGDDDDDQDAPLVVDDSFDPASAEDTLDPDSFNPVVVDAFDPVVEEAHRHASYARPMGRSEHEVLDVTASEPLPEARSNGPVVEVRVTPDVAEPTPSSSELSLDAKRALARAMAAKALSNRSQRPRDPGSLPPVEELAQPRSADVFLPPRAQESWSWDEADPLASPLPAPVRQPEAPRAPSLSLVRSAPTTEDYADTLATPLPTPPRPDVVVPWPLPAVRARIGQPLHAMGPELAAIDAMDSVSLDRLDTGAALTSPTTPAPERSGVLGWVIGLTVSVAFLGVAAIGSFALFAVAVLFAVLS